MLIKYLLNVFNPFHKPKFSVGDEVVSSISNTAYVVESVSERMYDLQPVYYIMGASNTVLDSSYTYSESINYIDATFKLYKKKRRKITHDTI